MKKSVLLLIVFLPLFSFSQNQVTMLNGIRFNCNIIGLYGNRLTFEDIVQEINSDKVDINSVVSIAGKIQKSTLNGIIKKNPKIVLIAEPAVELIESPTAEINNNNEYKPYNQAIELSAGDYLEKAGKRYVTGLGIEIGGAVLYGIGTTSGTSEIQVIGGIAAITGAIISITGHFQLIKAGKKMNSDAVTLTPASQGIGLAIHF